MNEDRISDIAHFAEVLDRAVAAACCDLLAERADEWSDWEVAQALEDLLGLAHGRDCTYDRPSIGVSYALWYHGARTHEALRVIRRLPVTADPLHIVDLGCGTGATACAAAIAVALSAGGGAGPRQVVVHGVDSSPFMVDVARRILGELQRSLPLAPTVSATFETGTWTDLNVQNTHTVVIGGYLFDHSDENRSAELADLFARLTDRVDAGLAVLFTNPVKREALDAAVGRLESLGYATRDDGLGPAVWSGSLDHCHAVRKEWYSRIAAVRPSLYARPPRWESNPIVSWLKRSGPAVGTLFDLGGASLLLDREQDAAAEPDEHLTVLVGAAGSGKSRVLAERVVRTLETARPSLVPQVLVTAFNIAMIDQLADWIEQRLSKVVSASRHAPGWVTLTASAGGGATTVTLMNRDKLPSRVLGQAWNGQLPTRVCAVAQRRSLMQEKFGAARIAEVEQYLTPEFLDEELERVIYGQATLTWEQYRDFQRRGRRKPLNPAIREIVWTGLMGPGSPDSFVRRRIAAYQAHCERIEAEQPLQVEQRWTHVFVDECQDFTESDFRLLACLPPDPQFLFVAGDETQSMNLGPCYRRPGLKHRQWRRIELSGSYRLPLRVCEALEDLAVALQASHRGATEGDLDLVLPESRKSAVIGPRPIVIAGDNATLERDLRDVLAAYRPLLGGAASPRVSIAERDDVVKSAIAVAAPWADLEIAEMRKIKGLERTCVVFSDRATFGGDEALPEWIYTALTRSRAVLVLVLWPDSPPAVRAVIGRLRRDRLLFWSAAARDWFDDARALVGGDDDPLGNSSGV